MTDSEETAEWTLWPHLKGGTLGMRQTEGRDVADGGPLRIFTETVVLQ
jgi:hypothetical protein